MLSQFASAGWQLWKSRANAEITAESEYERTTELATANQRLQLQVSQRERAEEQLQQFK
jgi:C4-dicarboxylate-specific signal transduction histidine kinase